MEKINDKNFALLWGEALTSTDRDIYVSEWSTSSIFPEESDLLEIAAKLGNIWDVAHMSVQEIAEACGNKRTKIATRFCIPYRTVENWCTGTRDCPDYIRLMMAELLGLIFR